MNRVGYVVLGGLLGQTYRQDRMIREAIARGEKVKQVPIRRSVIDQRTLKKFKKWNFRAATASLAISVVWAVGAYATGNWLMLFTIVPIAILMSLWWFVRAIWWLITVKKRFQTYVPYKPSPTGRQNNP